MAKLASMTGALFGVTAFEAADGASVTADGRVVYSERAQEALRRVGPEVAAGFDVGDLERAFTALQALRTRLGG